MRRLERIAREVAAGQKPCRACGLKEYPLSLARRERYDWICPKCEGTRSAGRTWSAASRVRSSARNSARRSAKRTGVYFDIPSAADLPEIPARCPLCCREMESGGDSRNNSPSLDRILPGLGYTVQNLWFLCHDCNRQKADLDPARAYALWDRVWQEIADRGLPLPSTRLRPKG